MLPSFINWKLKLDVSIFDEYKCLRASKLEGEQSSSTNTPQ